jgi:hypothetical protein
MAGFGGCWCFEALVFAELYISALAQDSPCHPAAIDTTHTASFASYILKKLRVASLLFLSIHLLSLLFTIKLDNVTMPILNFSESDRFAEGSGLPKHRVVKMSGASKEWLLTELGSIQEVEDRT